MEEKLKEVLDYYVLLNKLKTDIIDEDNGFSQADNIFGSVVLAVAMDSEFKETSNLGEILKLLILDGFVMNGAFVSSDVLNNNKKFENEFKKLCSSDDGDARLVYKYRLSDIWLTNLINGRSHSILLQNGIYNKYGYEEILKFHYNNCRLKNKIRSGWDNNHWNVKTERPERISEHVVGTMGLAIVMQKQFGYDIDLNKVLKMLAIHEIGEILIGDITPFDGITPEEKQEMEHQAMSDVLGNLTDKQKLLDLLFEFDKRESNEARFAYFCDKMEADLQSKLYQDRGMHRSLDDQENNVVFITGVAKKLIDEGAETAFDIWYGYDKHIYENDQRYPEFSLLLDTAKSYNMANTNVLKRSRVLRDK